MKNIFKIIILILVISIVSSLYTGFVFAATSYTWDDINTSSGVYVTFDGRSMPWRPADKYVSMQNPPDFTWPYVIGATNYELKICTDEAMMMEYKSLNGLINNYYNFNNTFETGVNYYWSVRYLKNDVYSSWSEPRRFRIDPAAYSYTVSNASELLKKIPSGHHPRVFTTDAEGYDDFIFSLDEFRAIKENNEAGKEIYEYYLNNARSYTESDAIPEEPTSEVYTQAQAENMARNLINQMYCCAFSYLLMEDGDEREEIGNFGVKAALALAGWSYGDGSLTSYSANDQVHREIIYQSAMAYDWLYDLMTEEERKTIRDMIVGRVNDISVGNYLTTLKKNPYSSHGWTTLGYVGITAYALLGDFGDETDFAKEWLEMILPFYSAIAPPWSTEDGGWSQGTDYWRYATNSNKEFFDVMALSGVINLYNKAWSKNEPVWMLYAYPKGSYGSFGDDANRKKSESSTHARSSMGRHSFFNDDTLARWLYKEQGGLVSSDLYNYYASVADGKPYSAPTEYPLGHEFEDIGWAVMTNDLEDPDRVQLTFKSSAYGSFNHSHADQNSFIIQAYGENLAIKGGYYDSYHSSHDVAITRPTFSHNSITVDGGYGQQDDRFNAKGNLSQFVNGLEFDSVTGEAAQAYNTQNYPGYAYGGNLDKFDRNIIYIRPDVFIVVDDLDAAGNDSSSFEWWLNAEHEMVHDDTSATISEGEARLKAEVLYPATTSTYYDTFTNPVNNTEYTPSGSDANKNVHTRVSFKTTEVPSTKMVVSMSVYENGGSAKVPAVSSYDTYMKLEYDNTTIYVSLIDNTQEVKTEDGISFKGAAVTLNDTSIMLTNGTYLLMNDKELISSDRAVTVSMGLGQICMSSDDDYNVILDTMNNYITVTDVSILKDGKGRALSSSTGVVTEQITDAETYSVSFSAQKGNYTIISNEDAVVSPGQLQTENVSVQKSGDGKAAVFWNKKYGRSYDVKINDTIYENVNTYPYIFDVKESIMCVYVREKYNSLIGNWSEPMFVSVYEKESHDKVVFSEIEKDKKTYIKAETIGFPSYGIFDMYLAKYGNDGTLQKAVKGETKNSLCSAEIEKTESGTIKAFIFGKDVTPLTSIATYGNSSCTDLLGIYADGKLIEGFDNSKNSYTLFFEKGQIVFPFITAVVSENTSKTYIDYDFDNFMVKITVKAADGTSREIVLKFKYNNVHVVEGATSIDDFSEDSYVTVDPNGNKSYKATKKVINLKFKNVTTGEYEEKTTLEWNKNYCLYTNMKGNSGNTYRGARVYSNRYPNSGNQYEIYSLPEEFEGYDYFVLWNNYATYAQSYNGVRVEFDLAEDADVIILSSKEKTKYEEDGFEKGKTEVKTRYMDPFGVEDLYYNIDLLKVGSLSDLNKTGEQYRLNNYDDTYKWYNVKPVSSNTYKTYAEYQNSGLDKSDFIVSGTANSLFVNKTVFNYKYTKSFAADDDKIADVSIELDPSSVDIIVIKPRVPKAFY